HARLLSGRDFTDLDNDQNDRVVIVNRTFAIQAWGDTNVVGRRLGIESGARLFTVIGVVSDIRAQLETPVPPVVFIPMLQSTAMTMSTYVVRTTGSPMDVLPAVRDAVKQLDPNLAVSRVATMEDKMRGAVLPRR